MSSDTSAAGGSASPGNTRLPLARAEAAALSLSDTQTVGAGTLPCSRANTVEREVIEVRVEGDDGIGLDGVALLLSRSDGSELPGRSSPSGQHRFIGLNPGAYQLSLPDLDRDAWSVTSTGALTAEENKSSGTAAWKPKGVQTTNVALTHTVMQGECVGSLSERYGFFAGTIWQDPANTTLRISRHGNMHVLFQGDALFIPSKRQQVVEVSSGARVVLKRRGVPERFRVRFLDYDEAPRADIGYLLSVETDNGVPVAAISGHTDREGVVDCFVSPNATFATIHLLIACGKEVHTFNLGHLNPIDEVSGWQARLCNLGYYLGPLDGVCGEKTQAAIRAFQRVKNLNETGEMDKPTRQSLEEMSLC